MKQSRYQYQNGWVKAYRWLRWMPYYSAVAIFRIIGWALRGCQPIRFFDFETDDGEIVADNLRRREVPGFLWSITTSEAHHRMGYWYTWDEVRSKIRT